MTEGKDAKRNDGVRWRCHHRGCRREKSIREGSFFSFSKLQLTQIVDLMYYYSHETASYKNVARECNMAKEAIANWRNYIRDVYAEHFVQHPLVIGGPGHTVEIDESAFVRRKHNVGRQVATQWVFGGLDNETKEGFLVAVPHRNAATLLPILQQYVLPGTTAVSDLWAAYNTVGNLGYQHLTVNHSVQFVNPVNQATTNHVESMWSRAKQRNKRECGTHRDLLDSYLIEFMWRQKYGKEPFQKLLEHVREVYPV
jgi:transposase-like protein